MLLVIQGGSMRQVQVIVLLLALSITQFSCTAGGGGSSSSSVAISPDTGLPTSSPNQISPEQAQGLIQKIQQESISNEQYALTEQDEAELASEGLVEKDELKAWVK